MKYIIFIILFGLNYNYSFSQNDTIIYDNKGVSQYVDFKFDSSIVKSYEHLFGLELYIQNKNLDFKQLSKHNKNAALNYEPNTNVALGLGFTYRYLALSAAVNLFPYSKENSLKTKSFDFQSQVIGQRFVSYITAQFYKGFFSNYNPYYLLNGNNISRPDMGYVMLGLNNMYAFNKNYSFRGSMLRFQRMLYTVSSPIVVLDANFLLNKGQESFVPNSFASSFNKFEMNRYRMWNIGLGAGYAYTWVLNNHFLFSGIVSLRVPLNFVQENYINQKSVNTINSGLNANLILRAAYDTDKWSLSFNYNFNKMFIGHLIVGSEIQVNYGYARLMYSRRFGINRKFKKRLKPIDTVLDIPLKILNIK